MSSTTLNFGFWPETYYIIGGGLVVWGVAMLAISLL